MTSNVCKCQKIKKKIVITIMKTMPMTMMVMKKQMGWPYDSFDCLLFYCREFVQKIVALWNTVI